MDYTNKDVLKELIEIVGAMAELTEEQRNTCKQFADSQADANLKDFIYAAINVANAQNAKKWQTGYNPLLPREV